MYLNGLIDFPSFQRLHNVTEANETLLIKNSKGVLVETLAPYGTFDMRNPTMRELFVSDAAYGLSSGVVDGVFIDRANWASRGLLELTNGQNPRFACLTGGHLTTLDSNHRDCPTAEIARGTWLGGTDPAVVD